jgi:hypothetical protein
MPDNINHWSYSAVVIAGIIVFNDALINWSNVQRQEELRT